MTSISFSRLTNYGLHYSRLGIGKKVSKDASHFARTGLKYFVVGFGSSCVEFPVNPREPFVHEGQCSETSVYVHWPYCKRICPYCNFNKYKSGSEDYSRLETCFKTELLHLLSLCGTPLVTSLYFGGGTPSLARPSLVSTLLQSINRAATLRHNAEVTLEVNPTDASFNKLRLFRDAGVTRISIGVQAFDDNALKELGRDHCVETAVRCIDLAMELFDGSVSFDLMFGRPGQTLEAWEQELEKAVSLGVNHISLYHLTMERGTAMHKAYHSGGLVLPSDDENASMYEFAVEYLADCGLVRYEVANFARKSFESQHNLGYWRGQPYIGVGPGAHGRLVLNDKQQREARVQILSPNEWMEKVESHGHGTAKKYHLTEIQRIEELVLSGMRTVEGVAFERLLSCGLQQKVLVDLKASARLQDYVEGNLIEFDSLRVRATNDGLSVVDSIIPDMCIALEELIYCAS